MIALSKLRRLQWILVFGGIPVSLVLGLTFPRQIHFYAVVWAVSVFGGLYLNCSVSEIEEGEKAQGSMIYGGLLTFIPAFFYLTPTAQTAMLKPWFAITILVGLIFFAIPVTAKRWIRDDRADKNDA